MRAPPIPRRSRVRYFTGCMLRLQHICTFDKVRRRWHLHKLHVVQRKGGTTVSPISAIRADDMINIPTGLRNKEYKKKPLLIASFPKGCDRSPKVRVLQKNQLSRIFISKRKYKLHQFDVTGIKARNILPNKSFETYSCAYTVRSIKKATSKNADVRVIFHDNNTIKSIDLSLDTVINGSPEYVEFGPKRSIRIREYKDLKRKQMHQEKKIIAEALLQPNSSKSIRKTIQHGCCITQLAPKTNQKKRYIQLTKFKDCVLISHSKMRGSS